MEISNRAHLANANKGLEAAAPIVVADWLREMDLRGVEFNDDYSLGDAADELDPPGWTEPAWMTETLADLKESVRWPVFMSRLRECLTLEI